MNLRIQDLLLRNIGIRQTVVKNTFWLVLAELVTSLLRFVLVIYVARILGAAEYGKFTFALSFVSLFAVVSDLGLATLITREFSMGREREQYYGDMVSLKIFLSLLVLVLTFIASLLVDASLAAREMIWVLMVFMFFEGFFSIIYPFIRARQKMEYEAFTKIIQTVLTVILGCLAIWIFPSALHLSYAYLAASLMLLLALAVYFHKRVRPLYFRVRFGLWKTILYQAWPMTFGFIGFWMLVNLDSAMIGFLAGPSQVGWFNAASKIIFAVILLFAGLVARSFYPVLSNLFSESSAALHASFEYYIEAMATLAFPVAVGGFLVSSGVVSFLYGLQHYAPSVAALRFLMLSAGVSLLCYPFSMILVIAGEQKKNFFIILAGCILNATANLVFIPRYGFLAAAASTFAICCIVLAVSIVVAHRYALKHSFNKKTAVHIMLVMLSTGLMALVITNPLIAAKPLVVLLIIGVLTYVIVFAILKYLTAQIGLFEPLN